MIAKELDDFRRGDTIKIKLLNDVILNADYQGKTGIVEKIDYKFDRITGTWGNIELYPEYDEIEIIDMLDNNPR